MKRKIISRLLVWKNNPAHLPLLLYGARQVGKTFIINEFGRQYYDRVIYVNFETHAALAADFDGDISPARILNTLEIYFGTRIEPGRTLIFFDEIQSCERALTSLKYFAESAPEQHIIAAGSLLGVALNRDSYSFPVGKVELLHLYPLDLEEFFWAMGHEALAQQVRTGYAAREPLPSALHEQALSIYRQYLITGGMPAVVEAYRSDEKLIGAGNVQSLIVNSYVADMAKYATASETTRIMAAYNSIPAQLAKDNRKFQYKVVQRGGTATIFGAAIDWLCAAGLVIRCQRVLHPQIPLAAHQDLSGFKLYMGDVGLLTLRSGMPAFSILHPQAQSITFMGALTENYVAQQLQDRRDRLFYWESAQTAEVDFLLQEDDQIIPVEVKSSEAVRSRSLAVYRERYRPEFSVRVSARNFGMENGIFSVPLYAVFCL